MKENLQTDSIRVLIVDDEVGFVDILTKRLSRRNMEVTAAYSGTEAIQILRKQEFDVTVLDLKMEEMDGIEVLKIFKKMDPKMMVIMLTGHATVESAIEGMKLGAYDYLMKPCDMDTLMAKVNEARAKKAKHEDKILEAQMKEITLRRGF